MSTPARVRHVGYVATGEWIEYTVNVPTAGTYPTSFRVGSWYPELGARTIAVSVDGAAKGTVTVPLTGTDSAYQSVTVPLALGAGQQTIRLTFTGARQNLDWFEIGAGTVTTPTPTPIIPGPTPQTVPFGPGNLVPGRVQAENFDKNGVGAANAAYSDTTSANQGNAYRTTEPVDIEYIAGIYDVCYIRTGEWLIYTVQVANPGTYTASFKAANPDPANKAIDVYVDGTKAGTAQIGTTGSFSTFKLSTFQITFPTAGTHQIKLAFPSERLNIDYVEFATGGTVITTTTTPTTPPVTGSANFVAVPTTATHGSAFKFTVTPKTGKTISSAWWSFDAPAHLNTWNSRTINPTFYYTTPGTYSPRVELKYTDGTTEVVHKINYIKST